MESLAADPHRPRYHFLPRANWLNDPNGTIFWKGRYHLFYQHRPHAVLAGEMHWGHAASDDLLRWTHLPLALSPTPGGADRDGCWSGCALDCDGRPAALYTGVQPEVQCLATGDDDLLAWRKHPGNPILSAPPAGLEVTGFRDPCAWRDGDGWSLVIGSGLRGVGGAALLYRSSDLVHWDYQHPLCLGDRARSGEMWECPDFFPLGDRHVLLVSALRRTLYSAGRYGGRRLQPERDGACEFGGYFYAARSLLDGKGRRLLWGWMWEGRSKEAQKQAGWAGVMSVPWVLRLGEDGALGAEPAEELKSLRRAHRRFEEVRTNGESPRWLENVSGDCLEIEAEVELHGAGTWGLAVRASPDGREATRIIYDARAGALRIDRERSSLAPEVHRELQQAPLAVASDEPLRLRLLLDRSALELFAQGRCCLTSRIYPTRPDSLRVGLFSRGDARLRRLDVWDMAPLEYSGQEED